MPGPTRSLLLCLRALVAPWAVAAVLLAGCATATGEGVDAGPSQPPPDANLADAPYSVALYVRGTFNGFDTSSPLVYQGNNRYIAVVSLVAGAHELQIADAGFSEGTTFAVSADRPAAIQLGQPTGLVPSAGTGNNMQLSVPQTGTYRFELSATDRTSPVLLIALASPAPYENALYVRGSFNGFDTSAPLPYQGSSRYLASLGLEAGTYEFKIADQGFSMGATFGLPDANTELLLDVPTTLAPAPGAGNDILLTIPETGTYRVELIATLAESPVLLVSLEQLAPYPVPLYVRGSFNDFDTSVQLRYRGQDRYAVTIGLDSGIHEFKIADVDFVDAYSFSISPRDSLPIELDRPTTLVPTPDDVPNETTLEIATTASYEFELTVADPQAPVLRVRRVAPAPYPVDLFVVGTFNQFEPVSRLRYQGANRYTVTLSLPAGQHALKIADAGFSEGTTFSVSASGEASIALDTRTVLERATGANDNTLLGIAQAGDYRFLLAADNPVAPVLLISRQLAR